MNTFNFLYPINEGRTFYGNLEVTGRKRSGEIEFSSITWTGDLTPVLETPNLIENLVNAAHEYMADYERIEENDYA